MDEQTNGQMSALTRGVLWGIFSVLIPFVGLTSQDICADLLFATSREKGKEKKIPLKKGQNWTFCPKKFLRKRC